MDILAKINEQDATTKGTLPQGFLYSSLKNVGTTPATVNGVSLAPGEAKGYPFVGKGYQEVDYDPQQSTLRILFVV